MTARQRSIAWLMGSLLAGLLLAVVVVVTERDPASPVSAEDVLSSHPTAASSLGILLRPRTSIDRLPAEVAPVLSVLSETFTVEPKRSKYVGALDPTGAKLYIVPTTSGRICFIILMGPAGCVASITRSIPNLTVYQMSKRTPPVVLGFVSRDAVRVEVNDGNGRRTAHLKSGVYWLEMRSAKAEPKTVEVTYKDGEEVTKSIASGLVHK
jgi:hypothetical protein